MEALPYSHVIPISRRALRHPDPERNRMPAAAQAIPDPRRYFEAVGDGRDPIAEQEPVCLYLETTNRCNLLCETCPRTFEDLEPPADMSWELFTRIVDQFPQIARVVLHGVGDGPWWRRARGGRARRSARGMSKDSVFAFRTATASAIGGRPPIRAYGPRPQAGRPEDRLD